RDDEIVRRRVIQKMEFLADDASPLGQPSEGTLHAFYDAHPDRYRAPSRVSFHHLYFATDEGMDHATSRASAGLRALQRGAAASSVASDPFPDRAVFVNLSPGDIEGLFGRSQLAEALPALPTGIWSGPLRSGLGVHLVYVDGKAPGHAESFASVR